MPFFFWKPRAVRRRRYRTIITEKKSKLVFEEGPIEIQGNVFNIRILDGISDRSRAKLKDGNLTITLASGMTAPEKKKHASVLARRAITRAMLPMVEKRVRELNDLHFKSEIKNVRLKDTSTLWASCSIQNIINMDFRLLFAPPHIMDAIIVHELAHTKQRNHSRAYWDLVVAAMPDYKERRAWLRANAGSLKPVVKTEIGPVQMNTI